MNNQSYKGDIQYLENKGDEKSWCIKELELSHDKKAKNHLSRGTSGDQTLYFAYPSYKLKQEKENQFSLSMPLFYKKGKKNLAEGFKITAKGEVSQNAANKLENYLFGTNNIAIVEEETEEEEEEYQAPTFPVKAEQLEKIFGSQKGKLDYKEVAKAINKYSNEFGITNKERMAHFIAQIGHETGGFKKLGESCYYSKSNSQLKKFSRYYTSKRQSIALNKNSEEKTSLREMQNPDLLKELDQQPIWYFSRDWSKMYKIVNNQSEKEYIYKTEYNGGNGIKSKYVGNKTPNCPLFDYVYCCGKASLGNGSVSSKDGSRFRGRGYIHLTGRYNYNKYFYTPWKETYPNDNRSLDELVDLLRTDKDLGMKAAMVFWKAKGLNEIADNPNGLSDGSISKKVTSLINSGLADEDKRKAYYQSLKNKL